MDEKEASKVGVDIDVASGSRIEAGDSVSIKAGSAHLHRRLNASQVQLYAIGTAIGTGVFVSMGSYLPNGGPAGLFLGFVSWSVVLYGVNECYAEMVCHAPVPGAFVRFAAEWVDEALGFAVSWAFFFNQAFLMTFEVTAIHRLIGFWDTHNKMPVEATTFIVIVLYGLINLMPVQWFGTVEFCLTLGKVFLILLTLAFAFVTMLGGNPLHDRYGFRYWKTPGAFAEYLVDGHAGQFLGFLSCATMAAFIICGPEYIAMVASETQAPRRVLPAAYSSFKFRLLFFFCGAALAMGIVVPYNDPTLAGILSGDISGSGTSAASPYVIAMERLNIPGLANFFNAIVITSVFSAGNGYVFSSSRALYTMAVANRAPAFLAKTTRNGVPIYAVGNIFFPGEWSLKWFFLNYAFLAIFPLSFLGWKLFRKTQYRPMGTADLGLGGDVKEIDDYEELIEYRPLTGLYGLVEKTFGGMRSQRS
ncbi:hypothetical protein LTR62_003571 [Meristemomyces frigidus]|uniref:Amino acid permease/ SLC12A domain-containing protein n=1 Tax=Meristemomyces frigidus TaxID=1508187 RepID=A0AAN7TEU2_9PEZI|nr:hypothetical protein LTR62_003571 [Meristemomyces frigidus]